MKAIIFMWRDFSYWIHNKLKKSKIFSPNKYATCYSHEYEWWCSFNRNRKFAKLSKVYLLIQGYLYHMYVLFVQCLFLEAPQHHYTLIATHWPGTNLDNLVENVVYIHLIVLSEGRDLMCMFPCFNSIG